MNTSNLFVAMLIAVGFVAWPIVGKYSQATGAWVGTIVLGATAVAVALISGRQLTTSFPTAKGLVILGIAGVVNGAACYYYAVKTADPAIPSGIFVVVVVVSVAALAPLFDWVLNGSVPTIRQGAGFACVAAAIYLLGR